MNPRAYNAHIIRSLREQVATEPDCAPPLREAAIFAGVLERLPIFHCRGDLLVGDFGWRPEDDASLRRLFPETAPPGDAAPALTPQARLNAEFHCFGGYSPAHTCIDYGTLLRLGVDGMMAELDAAGGGLYRRAMKTALAALLALAARFADAMEKQREPELAALCRNVPRRPARTFREALQSIWLVHLAIPISEYSDASISLGRLDQYAYPCYQESLESGCSESELEEQFAALVWKLNRYGDPACALNLGGLDEQGRDLCNSLTRMIVRVVKALKRPAPILAARIHPHFPRDIFDALIDPDLFAIGQPSFYGEVPCQEALRERGVRESDISRWAVNSCMGLVVEGAEVSNMWGGVVNCLLPLELAANRGQPFLKTLPISLGTPAELSYETFDALYAKFLEYLRELTGFCVECSREATDHVKRERPNPFLSAFLTACIHSGADRLAGGVSYATTIVEGFGLVNAADALLAVKTLVFEQGAYRLDELVGAAKDNFQGHNEMLRRIRDVPKFGNGDAAADSFVARLADTFQKIVRSHSTAGEVYAPSFHTLNVHVRAGKKYGASLDGRLSGEPLAKNIGTSPGKATAGLTALIRSAAAIDQRPFFGGQALDLSIAAPLIRTTREKRKLQSLIQTYFDLGGLQIQVNGLDAAALREAIDRPEAHCDLMVRIGGYSDYFNNLGLDVREEMVRRVSAGL